MFLLFLSRPRECTEHNQGSIFTHATLLTPDPSALFHCKEATTLNFCHFMRKLRPWNQILPVLFLNKHCLKKILFKVK